MSPWNCDKADCVLCQVAPTLEERRVVIAAHKRRARVGAPQPVSMDPSYFFGREVSCRQQPTISEGAGK